MRVLEGLLWVVAYSPYKAPNCFKLSVVVQISLGSPPPAPCVHNSGFSSFLNDGNEWPEFCSRITPKDACTYAIKVVHFPERGQGAKNQDLTNLAKRC
jgi:hypothetical protein